MISHGEPLCKTCNNREIDWVLVGKEYVQKLVCVYDKANYPNMHKCIQHEPDERGTKCEPT